MGALPRIVNASAASAGLTTPPGALAPWNPASGPQPAIIPLLDGSAVVQVRPPTSPGQPALVSVALDPSQVASNRGSVIPVAPMGDVPGRVFPKSDDTPVTANIRPVPRDPTA